ncbi:MAG: hypothetical protein ACT4P3_17880 [Betaproteobacteria bacterium]
MRTALARFVPPASRTRAKFSKTCRASILCRDGPERGAASSSSGMVERPVAKTQRPARTPDACRTFPGRLAGSRTSIMERGYISRA